MGNRVIKCSSYWKSALHFEAKKKKQTNKTKTKTKTKQTEIGTKNNII